MPQQWAGSRMLSAVSPPSRKRLLDAEPVVHASMPSGVQRLARPPTTGRRTGHALKRTRGEPRVRRHEHAAIRLRRHGTAGHERARELVGSLRRTRSGAVNPQVLQDFYVNAVRMIAKPLTPTVARERVRILVYRLTHVPGTQDVPAAIEIAEQEQLSFWDAMIIRSASELGCATLWTEGLNAGQIISGVRISNPFTS